MEWGKDKEVIVEFVWIGMEKIVWSLTIKKNLKKVDASALRASDIYIY